MNKSNIIFWLGAAAGSLTTWILTKEYYKDYANEAVKSVIQAFVKKERKLVKETPSNNTQNSSSDEEEIYKEEAQRYKKTEETVYVIPPEEFGELDDYEALSLTYYSDGILTDEDDEVINDINDTIGKDSLNHFGEYEQDSVFVRNDVRHADYEILLDVRSYAEIRRKMPE